MDAFVTLEGKDIQREQDEQFVKRVTLFPAEFARAGRAGAFFQNAQQAHDKQREVKYANQREEKQKVIFKNAKEKYEVTYQIRGHVRGRNTVCG